MPLPDAWGENRRTSQAAIKGAAAQVATTNKNPASFSPCAQAISASRKRSACWSVSRKIAPTSPAAAPAMSVSSASTSRLPWPSVTCDVFCIIGEHRRSRQECATPRRKCRLLRKMQSLCGGRLIRETSEARLPFRNSVGAALVHGRKREASDSHPGRLHLVQNAVRGLGKYHGEPGRAAGGREVADRLRSVGVEEGRGRQVEHHRQPAREGEPQGLVVDR